MPLADKIMELRKKQGWSQIDLADRLDVSRQSVSKWEMAQAVPELDKIIKMSELFAVTTDYLLKDDTPKPDSEPQPEPGPGPESGPQPETGPAPGPGQTPGPVPAAETPEKPRRKKWPWVLAAVLLFFVCLYTVLAATGAVTYTSMRTTNTQATPAPLEEGTASPAPAPDSATDLPSGQAVTVTIATPSPSPATIPLDEAAGETVEEAPPAIEQTAISDPDAVEDGMTEYVYEGESVTGGGFDQATLEAMAAEYAPYGLTCDEEHHWYLDGQRIRNFTDILASNGESLTGGNFHGTMRHFCGDGFIDVRTVRDYDHCDSDGVGELLYLESCDVRLDSAHWTEHHAEDHHDEDHHE